MAMTFATMLDPDTYFSLSAEAEKPGGPVDASDRLDVTMERLEGGCVLYALGFPGNEGGCVKAACCTD